MIKTAISAALKSGKGLVRANNEDAFYFNGRFAEIQDMDRETCLDQDGLDSPALFAICDGMGGHENGEVASYTAVSRMSKLQAALKSTDFSTVISNWVEETNTAITQIAKDGGSTLALLFIQSDQIHIAHIGDSRIYGLHHGKLSRITKDHSKLQVLLDAGLITEEEAEDYPYKHVITRALGMSEEQNGKCMPTIHEPIPVQDQDKYLICSDGVTDMLSDDQIGSLLSQHKSPRECAEDIYRAALQAGGKDNTSLIVIEFKCVEESESDLTSERDALESTWTPEQEKSELVSIEQMTTIRQANGQHFSIKTQISGTHLNGLFSLN